MARAEQIDLIEAEPQPAKQREDEDQAVKQHEGRDEQESAPVASPAHDSALW